MKSFARKIQNSLQLRSAASDFGPLENTVHLNMLICTSGFGFTRRSAYLNQIAVSGFSSARNTGRDVVTYSNFSLARRNAQTQMLQHADAPRQNTDESAIGMQTNAAGFALGIQGQDMASAARSAAYSLASDTASGRSDGL